MRWSNSARNAALVSLLAGTCAAQQLIGYVNKRDANVTGATDELDGQAVLVGSASVAAKDHTAPIKLSRGGTVNVCQSSEVKITESREVSVAAPLLFSLNRGSVEIETIATSNDSIMTPDLRFTLRSAGPLDLRVRVARNGDTCVENRGAGAPTLAVSDPFGESMYELPADQHVTFVRGSVATVIDHEAAPCGCPAKSSNMAEALLAPGTSRAGRAQPEPVTPAAAQHPFPAAQPTSVDPAAQPAESPTPAPPPVAGAPQISDTLSYSGAKEATEPKAAPAKPTVVTTTPASAETSSIASNGAIPAAPTPAAPAAPRVAPKQEEPPVNDVVHIVARVFRKLFGRH